jgi:hypothetical protein
MSFWQKLFGGGEPEPDAKPVAAETPDTIEGLPYGIADRPMPKGEDPNRLLPIQVGQFTREPIKPPGKGMPSYANYQHGAATVFVELGVCDNAHDAQMSLETARGETAGEFPDTPHLYAKRGDSSCWRTINQGGAFLAWTRGRYYFSTHAKGGERDLEEFVKGFPY